MTNSVSEQQVKGPGFSSLSTMKSYMSALLLAGSSPDCAMATLVLEITCRHDDV